MQSLAIICVNMFGPINPKQSFNIHRLDVLAAIKLTSAANELVFVANGTCDSREIKATETVILNYALQTTTQIKNARHVPIFKHPLESSPSCQLIKVSI